jgi:hypothetical protein
MSMPELRTAQLLEEWEQDTSIEDRLAHVRASLRRMLRAAGLPEALPSDLRGENPEWPRDRLVK